MSFITPSVEGFGDVAVFKNRQPVTAAKFITKSSFFILSPGAIRRVGAKPNSESGICGIIYSTPRHMPSNYVRSCCSFVSLVNSFLYRKLHYFCSLNINMTY